MRLQGGGKGSGKDGGGGGGIDAAEVVLLSLRGTAISSQTSVGVWLGCAGAEYVPPPRAAKPQL